MGNLSHAEELLLKIYSIDYLLKCKVDEVSEPVVILSPISGKIDMFTLHDPVVLLHLDHKQLHILPADVAEIRTDLGQVAFKLAEIPIEADRRIFERYPVSLTVSARKKYSSKRLHLIAKNISLYGMGVISEVELEKEDLIDIDLITDRNMFYLSGKIMWKANLGIGFEYGLQLTHYDVATKSAFEGYLENQKTEYLKMLSKAR